MLKLTVASYYRPSGENIHRFKNAKNSDKWGVSPDPGAEVKLPTSEFIRWFRARVKHNQDSSAKGRRKNPAPAFETEKTKPANDEKPKQEVEGKTEDKKPPGEDKNKAAATPKSPHVPAGKFIDKQLDKALELLRAKLAEANKAA